MRLYHPYFSTPDRHGNDHTSRQHLSIHTLWRLPDATALRHPKMLRQLTDVYHRTDGLLALGEFYPHKRIFEMAKDPRWKFIECRLTADDAEGLERFSKGDYGGLVQTATELSSMGYKLSVSFIDKQNAFVATVSGSDRSKYNNGTSISSWSDDLAEAILMCGYKVIVLANRGDWEVLDAPRANWG